MKYLIASIIAVLGLNFSTQAAAVSVKLTDVHLCCQSCVKGVAKAVEKVPGITATSDSDEGTVSLTGPDTASVQKAVDAIVKAGYFGTSSNPEIKVTSNTGATGAKIHSMKVEEVHLCCAKCVKAVNKALASVEGVQANTAVKDAKSFEVTGDFNDQEVFSALQKAGLTGKAAK